jgi:T-complex protein 1 subunit theta
MILTSDAATILRELEVVHPAAKLLVMASQQQEAEMGDGTNMVIVLAGELLKKAEELLRMGLKTSDIVTGYEIAQEFALKALEGMFKFEDIFSLHKVLTTGTQSSKSTRSKTPAPPTNSQKPSVLSFPPNNPAPKISLQKWLQKPS